VPYDFARAAIRATFLFADVGLLYAGAMGTEPIPLVEFVDVCFSANGQALLDRLNWKLEQGQAWAVLGPNGAGKTTVLRILSTVLSPTSGIALVDGFDVARDPADVRRRIGFVSNNTAIYDRMTAWEMVEYFGRLHGIEAAPLAARMEAIFKRLQMNEFRDMLGAKMSTGMKQKVSIARAIVHDPPVLIFDEATSGLDVLVARALLDAVAELRDEGKCIVFSTHIMQEVEALSDQIVIVARGCSVAHGTAAGLREKSGCDSLEDAFVSLALAPPARGAA